MGWMLAAASAISLLVALIFIARNEPRSTVVTIALAVGLISLAFATRALFYPASDWWIAAGVGVSAATLVIIGVRGALGEPNS